MNQGSRPPASSSRRRARSTRAVAALAIALLTACGEGAGPAQRVFLPAGSSFRTITDSLVRRGVVAHPSWFRTLARLGRFDRKVKAGLYDFREGQSAWSVLHTLTSGDEITVQVTVPEGYTIFDIADVAASELRLSRDSVLAAARDPAVLQEFGVDGSSMEGYLLPETYNVSALITARDLVRDMAQLFQRTWQPTWDTKRQTLGLSRRELVTLASIVEAEAKVDEDRPLVAAVYTNRMKLGMLLQADPTVQYALQLETGARKPRLLLTDYKFSSPYNTYLHPGLPPSPVGAPSPKSIEAVLNPAPVPYLYFVAGANGKHVFTRSYGEHLRAIARIRGGH